MTPVRLEPTALRSPVKHSTTEPLHSLMETLVLENQYKIAVPIFGASYAAPNKGTILYCFRSTVKSRILGLFEAFEVIFQYFSRQI